MIWTLLAVSALAAPPDFRETRTDVADGCTLFLGPADASGVVPMRAECTWPDVTVDQFKAAYGDWARHDDIYTSVGTSVVLSTSGNTAEVRQTFEASGIKTREMIIDGTTADLPNGIRYSWTKHPGDQGITSGNVEVERSDGFWEVTSRPAGGVLAVHQVSYAPGGRVPGFLIRWFQTGGLQEIAEDTRRAVHL